MQALPKVGNLKDESDAPWVYLAITSRGKEWAPQGIRLVVEAEKREQAIELGRSHYRLLTTNIDGNHFRAELIEAWAYNVEEAEMLQWESAESEVVTKRKKKG